MKVHLRLGRRRMGLRHVSQLKGPARLGEDLRAALADMVTHRRIRQAHRVVLIDQPGQDPPRRMALLLGRIQVTAQHGVDRGLERLQPRRDPLRGLARRRNRRFQRLTHGAPVHTVLVGQPPNRQPVDPMIAANRRKLLHPRPHPSASTFVTSGPGYPDADHAEAGPVQAVPTVAACRKVGPNQTVKTTPRHHAGGATSSRPPGANSGCHGQSAPSWPPRSFPKPAPTSPKRSPRLISSHPGSGCVRATTNPPANAIPANPARANSTCSTSSSNAHGPRHAHLGICKVTTAGMSASSAAHATRPPITKPSSPSRTNWPLSSGTCLPPANPIPTSVPTTSTAE